jgi:hypothetical protein
VAEPQSAVASALGAAFGLAATSAWLGPILGPWAMVIAATLLGAVLAATETTEAGVKRSALIFIRAVCVALPCTGAVVYFAGPYMGDAHDVALMPAALLIAWQHERVPALVRAWVIRWRSTRGGS